MVRVDQGAYANLVVPELLRRSDLEPRDRGLVTELVYGATRMRRACDWLVDRYLIRDTVDPEVRAGLRLGAYQLQFMGVADHAAVGETVGVVPRRGRGVVNAVLRKVAGAGRVGDDEFPSDAVRLSYPDWIVEMLDHDLGRELARAALVSMNEPAEVDDRGDGYLQDPASRWVVESVPVQPGDLILDLCAAPGGKASALARTSTTVASDLVPARVRRMARNLADLDLSVPTVVGDATAPPFRARHADQVLVDAPCSGLGALRRRADARWRIEAPAVERLAGLQRRILERAVQLCRPGGIVTYSVCTLTDAESVRVVEWAASHLDVELLDPPGPPWERLGPVARILPQWFGTDGMALARFRA